MYISALILLNIRDHSQGFTPLPKRHKSIVVRMHPLPSGGSLLDGPACSERMSLYFQGLKAEAERAAAIARTARSKGFDPVRDVEIPFADDLAGRVENLVGPPGVAEKIRALASSMSREALTLNISQQVAQDLKRDREKALAAGCTGYIEKPIDPERFIAQVERYFIGKKGIS